MRHFISFQKKKALFIEHGQATHPELAHELNHELMAAGYILTKPAFDALASLELEALAEVHNDLVKRIGSVLGDGAYQPIYQGFPQSVLALSYQEFAINALVHYWTHGAWRPDDAEYLHRDFDAEPTDFTEIGVLTETQFERIFQDLLYSEVSLSAFDKSCVDWYLDHGGSFEFSRISFKETASYVGQRLLASDIEVLPTRRATDVLRIWSAFSGGDEGLKENTRFKSPSVAHRHILMQTLEGCGDLEDSFKSYREKWLRLLFYLHPQTAQHTARYPRLADHTDRLRNRPKTLRTFRSKVEAAIANKDPVIFDLLSKRPGAYMRRLDHLVRTFGVDAIYRWLELNLRFGQLITAYNHFSGRAEQKTGRGAVLAGAGSSEVVTYGALEPLDAKLVEHITGLLMERLKRFSVEELGGAVYIDPGLYYTPLATNNRASSLSLDSKVIGTTETYTEQDTLRLYVHWEGKSDIDLSGFAIFKDFRVEKVGWNASHHAGAYIVYSGDNTGLAEKNAEYLDINTSKVPEEIAWIIVEARIFRGPDTFKGYNGTARIGWMSRKHPKANKLWLPETVERATVLSSEARTAYLMAYHPETRQIVYLDMSMGGARVSTPQDAIRMQIFLERFVPTANTELEETSWKTLHQGHILELLASEVTDTPQSAEIVFDENTTAEQISRLMGLAVSS